MSGSSGRSHSGNTTSIWCLMTNSSVSGMNQTSERSMTSPSSTQSNSRGKTLRRSGSWWGWACWSTLTCLSKRQLTKTYSWRCSVKCAQEVLISTMEGSLWFRWRTITIITIMRFNLGSLTSQSISPLPLLQMDSIEQTSWTTTLFSSRKSWRKWRTIRRRSTSRSNSTSKAESGGKITPQTSTCYR